MTFSRSITKQPASSLEFKYFYSILQMSFCGPRQKWGERPFSAGIKHFEKFSDFFKTLLATLLQLNYKPLFWTWASPSW